jgi:ABC-type lipoprotein release transport system permease subunit
MGFAERKEPIPVSWHERRTLIAEALEDLAKLSRPRAAASPGLLLFLAWKALGENGLSLLLLLLAVAVGVGFQIPNRANLAGFRDEIMRQEVSSGLGHVRVRPRQRERFNDVADMLASIARLPSVKAVEPILVLPGAIKKGGHLVVLGVTGVNASASQHPYERTAGADLAPGDDHGALLGERLAKKLGVKVGDEVDVQVMLSSRPRLVLDDSGMGNYTLTVRGLVGFAALDSVFVDWGFLASETGDDRSASALLVWARNGDVELARQIASTIEHLFPDATALSWLDDSRYLRSIVGAVQALESIAGGMSLFGVIIPVLSLLDIDALHRRRQVSLLSAIGFREREIFFIFFAKALMVGLVGVLLGAGVGWGLLGYFNLHPIYNYEKFVIRPAITAGNMLSPMLLVLATTALAGSLPAWQAARVNPSDTLRRIE